MEMKGMMGGLYKISEWIMRLSVTNILWVICSLPFMFLVFTHFMAVATGTVSEEQAADFMKQGFILAGIVAPFTLFPATSAMFGVARKWVMGEVDAPLLKTFFRNYKDSYLQSMIAGIIYVVLFAVMIVDFQVYGGELKDLQFVSYLFIALLILLGVSLFNFFSMVVHYHMKTFQLIKNALFITIGRPFRSISTAVMCGVVIYISLSSPKLMFLIPFFTGSVVAAIAFWNFYGIYMKLQMQAEKAAAAEAEEARKEADEIGLPLDDAQEQRSRK
ncbi:YesL family protein [Paenibacillus methanolicus]|uniref:Putative membrane protein YesL n=1 Tax=Paenibacillus methanolicus TaxID=582686 RepID=A0A5S5BVW7_9BACL|nr:DUF624 domain-containing protein [Paenibacillus methanolicus]TYP71124.1 putative membrane protein YesL [Paenibacillus methanolicus]